MQSIYKFKYLFFFIFNLLINVCYIQIVIPNGEMIYLEPMNKDKLTVWENLIPLSGYMNYETLHSIYYQKCFDEGIIKNSNVFKYYIIDI